MLGKPLVTWDFQDIAKGMSSSDFIPDGGFSPSSDAMNLFITPGVMYSPAAPTDKSTSMVDEMIASCEDPAASAARLYTSADSSSQDGSFFSINSSGTLTQRGSTDTSHDYIPGKTDMIGYKGEVYVTNSSTIVRWQQPATFNTSFFSFADAFAPHPALVYEDNAFYGDGNELLRQTSAGGAPSVILTLPSNQVITALGIDPGSGRMLVAIVSQYNVSGTVNSDAKVGYYDGFSNKFSRIVPVDSMITAFPFTEGQLYAAYDTKLGYWNGAGITFLRNFDLSFDNTVLPYKHHFTSIGSTLFMIEKTRIIAHGPVVQGGRKVFYPIFKNQVNSNNLTNIAFIGSDTTTSQLISLSFASEKFYTWNIRSSASTNTQVFLSNRYLFDRPYVVRRAIIYYASQVASNVSPGDIRLRNEDGIVTGWGNSGLVLLTNASGASLASKELTIEVTLNEVQIELLLDTVNPGIRKVELFGDPANLP